MLTPAPKLTSRQRQILDLIRRYLAQRGYPPSRSEIAEAFGFRSVTAVSDHLNALARKGVIELRGGVSRGIRLLDVPPVGLPLVGQVAAGDPILALEHIEQYVEADGAMFYPAADFLLRVRGMSMRDAGIVNGDLLAVHKTAEAENGRILVLRLDDEVTVKRFRRDAQLEYRVRLVAENPDFADLEVDLREQELVVEGLAVGLIRNLHGDGLS